MKINQLKIGVILSYTIVFINTIVGIFLTPFMLKTLGQSQYGLYQLIGGFVGYMTILDFGLGNAVIRYVAKYRQEKNSEKESGFLSTTLILYSILSFLALIIGIILYINLDNIFMKTLSSLELEQAKIMFIILLINLVITLPGNMFNAIINAYEKFAFNRIFTIIRMVIRIVALILLLSIGYNAIAIVILDTIINIFVIIVNIIFCKVKLKVKIKSTGFDIKLVKEIFKYSIYVFLNIILDQLIWRAAPTIIGIKMSTKAVAIFAVGMQFSAIFMQFSTAISGVFLPKVTKMVTAGESKKVLTDFMIKVGRIQGVVLIYIYIAFLVLGRQFIQLWIGEGYNEAWLSAVFMMTGLLIPLMENAGLSILQAMKKHKFYVLTYLAICIFNVVLTVLLIDYTGIIGASIITMLGLFLGHGIIINWYYNYKIGLGIFRFFKELFKGIFPISIIVGIITYIGFESIKINSWLIFIVCGILFSLIYSVSMWFLGINQYEKNLVLKPLKKLFIRSDKV